jgi:hypothetical protein
MSAAFGGCAVAGSGGRPGSSRDSDSDFLLSLFRFCLCFSLSVSFCFLFLIYSGRVQFWIVEEDGVVIC